MILPYYILISKSESIDLTKNRTIDLPLSTRVINDYGDKDYISNEIKNKLTDLNINEDSDYLLLLVGDTDDNKNIITLKIDNILNQYCFTESALTFYQTTINENYRYEIISTISIEIDIDLIIRDVQNKKIIELIEDKEVFDISIKDIPINFEKSFEKLTGFKRECKLAKNDASYFNDVITIAYLSNGNGYNNYRSGENIAKKSSILKEIESSGYSEKCIKDLFHFKSENMENLNDTLKNEFYSELNDFSFIVFSLVYLKTYDIYQNSEDKILGLYENFENLLSDKKYQLEIKYAYYIFIKICGYENLYTDYYKFRQFKIITGSEELSYSLLREKAMKLGKDVKDRDEQLTELQGSLVQVTAEKDEALNNLQQQVSTFGKDIKDRDEQLTELQGSLVQVTAEKDEALNNLQQQVSTLGKDRDEQSIDLRDNLSNGNIAQGESISFIIPISKLTSLNKTTISGILSVEEDLEKIKAIKQHQQEILKVSKKPKDVNG